ncbi:MAG: hypothetical protein GEV10_14295 [Streptosporangiales bacterium]|nr:hypothetical protein [Streptosporangiales bacterium]
MPHSHGGRRHARPRSRRSPARNATTGLVALASVVTLAGLSASTTADAALWSRQGSHASSTASAPERADDVPGAEHLVPVRPPAKKQQHDPTKEAKKEAEPAAKETGGTGAADRTEAGPTKFGAAVRAGRGETYRQAVDRSVRQYGRLGVVRKFYPGLPAPWSRIRHDIGSLTPAVSFKASPAQVLSGRHDARLKEWFASAPTDRPIYWTYFHEPENDVDAGAYSPAQFTAAWKRISRLADAADKPNLKATLTLMCWSLEKGSKRDWRDYFAGRQYVDVLAWDCYNKAITRADYADPKAMLGTAIATGRSVGLPVAFGEFGSKLAPGDNGTRRAAWLLAAARYLHDNDVVYVSYFDSTVGGEFRLLDRVSQLAWRTVVTGTARWQR